MLLVCSAFEKPSNFAVCLGRLPSRPTHPEQSPSNSLTDFVRLRSQMNSALSCQTGMNSVCVEGKGAENFRVIRVVGGLSTQGAAQALPSSVGILKKTGKNREDIRDDLYPACHSTRQRLDSPDVLGLQAFGPLRRRTQPLTFLERAKSLTLDGRMMHEHVFAVCTAKEAESLRIVKPFYCSCSMTFPLLRDVSLNSSGIVC